MSLPAYGKVRTKLRQAQGLIQRAAGFAQRKPKKAKTLARRATAMLAATGKLTDRLAGRGSLSPLCHDEAAALITELIRSSGQATGL